MRGILNSMIQYILIHGVVLREMMEIIVAAMMMMQLENLRSLSIIMEYIIAVEVSNYTVRTSIQHDRPQTVAPNRHFMIALCSNRILLRIM
jgi:hypothetical protein